MTPDPAGRPAAPWSPSGLQPGERVVTTGFARLTQGAQGLAVSSAEDAGQIHARGAAAPGRHPRHARRRESEGQPERGRAADQPSHEACPRPSSTAPIATSLATVDCAAARDAYFKKTSRYVPIITDGGMSRGGDVCKALACGADAVMVGSAFAKAHEAPGRGYHWGMATPHANLPRGTRIKVGATGSLKQILFGPAEVDDGSQNLVGQSPLAWAT